MNTSARKVRVDSLGVNATSQRGARSMAEEQPSLHIDTDWKKQAQEEKRRLAEQAAKNRAATPAAPPPAPPTPSGSAVPVDPRAAAAPSSPSAAGRRARGQRELPPPGF